MASNDKTTILPPADPHGPGVQLPPPAVQTPHPAPDAAPPAAVPVTDGTPAPSRQKNAASFLNGDTPGVMASYGLGAREPGSPIPTQESEDLVRSLAAWRREAPYG